MTRILLASFLVVSGCTHLGPQTVTRDRFDYNTAISNSWKEQTLLNIVKLRYADMPLSLEVASVVSGYTLEGSVSLGGTVFPENEVLGNFMTMGGTGKYTDRPTITYAPITGRHFNKSFMAPIPPEAILFLMQSGWPVDLIFPLTVDTVNGLRSRIWGGANQRRGDADFYRVIGLLREVQKSGAVGMQLRKTGDAKETAVLFFHRAVLTPETEAGLSELSRLLGLRPGLREVKITYGLIPRTDSEIAMLTRSMLQIMIGLATHVDVPPEHVTNGRTVASGVTSDRDGTRRRRVIEIGSSATRPDTAFTAVKYRGHWFWIDDRDFKSKRTFAFLMVLFSLTETGGREGLPLVTIPAG